MAAMSSVLEQEVKSLLGSNILEDDFKTIRNRQIRGDKPHDVHHAISLSLEKIYLGASIKIRAEKKIPCQICSSERARRPCIVCRGMGHIFGTRTVCNSCRGTGFCLNPSFKCGDSLCKDGQIRQEKFFTVKVPPGARHGEQIRLAGQGDVLLNKPETVSDIVCTVNELPHDRFRRCGFDLYHIKTIDLRQALCGSKFVIEHLDKRKLAVHAKPGLVVKPGDMKLVKNEGMPVLNSKSGAKGDLIVIFNVFFPLKVDSTVSEQIESLLPRKEEFKDGGKDLEEFALSSFDPKEQVYHVPFRQKETFEDSPAKGPKKGKGAEKIPKCAQQ